VVRRPAHVASTSAAGAALHAQALPAASGTTYYVSPSGSDANTGTSPSRAWRTVAQVDRADLQPGDQVLFQGGATFSDDALMPGWGTGVSGTPSAPITFGSYGQGRAAIPGGIWFNGDSNLTFANLTITGSGDLGQEQGVNGTGDNITIEGCAFSQLTIGIQSHGSNWQIVNNSVDHTGDSGLLLYGDHQLVNNNVITNTGLDTSIPYGTHGIYLKSPNSTVSNNTIQNFHDDGVSVRYRQTVVTHNLIQNGSIGIAWFEYDTIGGVNTWTYNTISGTTDAGLFVSGDASTNLESFVISNNTIDTAGGVATNLHPTSGSYQVAANTVG
jgi:hypothetical protein